MILPDIGDGRVNIDEARFTRQHHTDGQFIQKDSFGKRRFFMQASANTLTDSALFRFANQRNRRFNLHFARLQFPHIP